MPTSLLQYEMLPTTWFFVSSLIIFAVFFKFNRFLSIRNLDLVGLIFLTPGLLLLAMKNELAGYNWLIWMACLLCIRMFCDLLMVRRPLLEPNLTPGGMTFACIAMFAFLIASITVNRADRVDSLRTVRLEQMLTVSALAPGGKAAERPLHSVEPGYPPFWSLARRTEMLMLPSARIQEEIIAEPASTSLFRLKAPRPHPSMQRHPETLHNSSATNEPLLVTAPSPVAEVPFAIDDTTQDSSFQETMDGTPAATGRTVLVLLLTTAILGHLMIVLGFIYIGHCHFGNIRTGIACATLYLLLPYTNQMIGRLDHVIPAALMVWAVAMYRRPFFSGLWIGTAAGFVFYPVFLLPLWISFYWKRGWIRFLVGSLSAIVLLIALLPAFPESRVQFFGHLIRIFGGTTIPILHPDGFWEFHSIIYRIPVIAGFFVVCFGLFPWPTHKHLGTLLSCSAFLMLAVQLWQPHQGGLFMAWYLPLVILTIFRPNLEDRVAQATVVE